MINEGISIVVTSEVNSNWIRITIKENAYKRNDGWFKTSRVSIGYKRVTNYDGLFQSGSTGIMAVNKVSCRDI